MFSNRYLMMAVAANVLVAAVLYGNLSQTEKGQQVLAQVKETASFLSEQGMAQIRGMMSSVTTSQCGLFPYTDYAIISNRVVLPGHGVVPAAIYISQGTITKISTNLKALPTTLKSMHFGNAVISPGFIDVHAHLNEPGREAWEGLTTGTTAAAKGGITTVIDMPLNSFPTTTTLERLRQKQELAREKSMINIGHWAGITPENAHDEAALKALWDGGALGFKAFMAPSGIDDFQHISEADLKAAIGTLKGFGAPLCLHAEIVTDVHVPRDSPRMYWTYMAGRPSVFEMEALKMITLALGQDPHDTKPGFRVHIAHLGCSECMKVIKFAQEQGLPITVETCPHYLSFSARQIAEGDTRFKCAPPIRGEDNREGLVNHVLDGSIDLIASDHSPAPPSMKEFESGDFQKAWGGISGIQYLVPATWTALRRARQGDEKFNEDLLLMSKILASEPAKLAGLGDKKGRIAPGYDADLTVWMPEDDADTSAAGNLHKHPISVYENMVLKGQVVATVVNGFGQYHKGVVDYVGCGMLALRTGVTAAADVKEPKK
ncbi:hypothetical protein FOA52_009230 [Chlamydomonas sp. UWO 241]|nr:hypothetical protein FOA52_009230 [Chlamydomonas sp. UWO 241]